MILEKQSSSSQNTSEKYFLSLSFLYIFLLTIQPTMYREVYNESLQMERVQEEGHKSDL